MIAQSSKCPISKSIAFTAVLFELDFSEVPNMMEFNIIEVAALKSDIVSRPIYRMYIVLNYK